jgi:uncharacterized protein YqgV (UPF0045/DUF77 family)
MSPIRVNERLAFVRQRTINFQTVLISTAFESNMKNLVSAMKNTAERPIAEN